MLSWCFILACLECFASSPVLWYNYPMAEQKDPQNLGLEAREGGNVIPFPQARQTQEAVSKTLEESKAEGAKTLKDYLEELEKEKGNPVSAERLRKLKLILIFLGKYVKVSTDKILLKKLGGDAVGEAHQGFVEIDPVLLKQDDLSIFTHTLFHEYGVHLMKGIDNEGMTEVETMRVTGDKAMDYEAETENVLQVVGLLNEDKDKAILRAVELYSNEKYDDLFEEFAEKYAEKYPEKVAQNSDAALNTFQLAFPELHVSEEGGWEFDEEKIGEEEGEVEAYAEAA